MDALTPAGGLQNDYFSRIGAWSTDAVSSLAPGSLRERLTEEAREPDPSVLQTLAARQADIVGGPPEYAASGPQGFFFTMPDPNMDPPRERIVWLRPYESDSAMERGDPIPGSLTIEATLERMDAFRDETRLLLSNPEAARLPDSGAASPRARAMLDIARRMLAFQPEFQVIPTAEETARTQREEDRLEENRNVYEDRVGLSSIGGPIALSGPTDLSGPVDLSGPLNSVSGPPLPLRRPEDPLYPSLYPFDRIDGPSMPRLTQESYDLHVYGNPLTAQRAMDASDIQEALSAGMRVTNNILALNSMEDARAFAYNNALVQLDSERTVAIWAEDRAAGQAAWGIGAEQAENELRVADQSRAMYAWQLEADLGQAYAYSRMIDESGLAESAVPEHIEPVELPATQAVSAAEGVLPQVDASRGRSDDLLVAGYYPLDRPPDMIYAAPPVERHPEPVAVEYRQDLERIEAARPDPSPDQARQEADRLNHDPAMDAMRPANDVGLAAVSLAPLSIGISFTV